MAKSVKLALLLLSCSLLAAWAVPAQAVCGSPVVTPLYAGQTLNAGTVTVSNDASYIYVRYTTNDPWEISDAHLAVASSLAGIPQTKKGNPIPGHFAYSAIFNPEVTDYTFTIPIGSFFPGQTLYVAAHAVVQAPSGSGGTQTGWGFGPGFPGANWATYIQYTVQSCGGPVE
ncbi:MAG: hypothetical protein QOJ16_1990 [Acidobacteriota bacterium]|jgi:hypothetical protein|nr:hypothetical protein [Acidobacteriota bacterium]